MNEIQINVKIDTDFILAHFCIDCKEILETIWTLSSLLYSMVLTKSRFVVLSSKKSNVNVQNQCFIFNGTKSIRY